MEKAEVKAMVGKKAVLEMHGKHLDGKWEVVVQGVVENNPRFKNHAKVLWQKPATQYNEADTKPETHYVPLGSLKATKAQLKAREERAQVRAERKVAQKSLDKASDLELLQVLASRLGYSVIKD